MRHLTAILGACLFAAASAGTAGPVVGMHRLTISEAGERTRLVSVPFLRMPDAYGRLDGVQISPAPDGEPLLIDHEGAFGALAAKGSHILRITSGSSAGDWFLLDKVAEDGRSAAVREDGLVASAAQLVGDEAFAIHRLFTLGELFPVRSPEFPAAPIDLAAMQVHFYDGAQFNRYWLSDGTLTGHRGWTFAEDGQLRDANQVAILPGASFLVVFPDASTELNVQINGVVPETGLTVPVYPGYNYVSVKYTRSTSGGLPHIVDYLKVIGLKASGFKGGSSDAESDLVLALMEADGTFLPGYYYDEAEGDFSPVSEESGLIRLEDVGPGRGFVIYNSGDTFLWRANPNENLVP